MCGIVHFTLSIYIDEIAFHQNSLPVIFHRGSYLLAKYVFIRSWKKHMKPKLRLPSHIPFTQQQQKNGRIPDIYMENTCFHQQISICCHKFSLLHVCKTICASFASFFNKPFLFETSKISLFTENHLANTNQKKGKIRAAFSAFSVFCFKNRKYVMK